MLFRALSYLPVVAGSLLVGLMILLKNRHSRIHILFGSFAIFLGTWHAMLFVGDTAQNPQTALWAVRLATLFGTPMIASLIFFAVVFPRTLKPPSKLFIRVNIALPIVFSLLAISPWLIPSVEIRDNSAQPTNLGILYSLQSLYAVGGFIFSIFVILRKYRHVDQFAKAQIRLVAGGLVVAMLVNTLTGFILTMLDASNNYSNLVGSVSFLIFVVATSYAIVRHRMFDIRMTIVRSIGYIVTLVAFALLYTLLIVGVIVPFFTRSSVDTTENDIGIYLLIPATLFIAATFHSLQDAISRVTRKVFYQDLFDIRQVLDAFSDKLVGSNDIDTIMTDSLKIISEAIKPMGSYFIIFDEHGRTYKTKAHSMRAPASLAALLGDLKQYHQNPLARDNLLDENIPDSLRGDDIYLVLHLGSRDRPVGVLLFGAKHNGRSYNSQDLDLLRISAKNLTLAIENAKKYEQISQFADKLHKEVLSATADLRKANAELKTLDTMKDDFISMASHQLRTPASAVNQALNMLNQTALKLSKDEKEKLLQLAEASSEHLVAVVADMLSISRIQAGHFVVTPARVALQDVLSKVLTQTSVLAEQKGIALTTELPKEPLFIDVDVSKITEAFTNYIENAIKYSPEHTTVHVTAGAHGDHLVFEVTDQGMGVPEKEQKNLFGRFYRAANARQYQPDGNGIGLFVVKSVAEGHGGSAYYKPLKKGSLFGIKIPLTQKALMQKT